MYVGIVVQDGKVTDLMTHRSRQESEDNLADSPNVKAGVTSVTCWKVEGNTVEQVSDLTQELLGDR